jgi:hypothetical protein
MSIEIFDVAWWRMIVVVVDDGLELLLSSSRDMKIVVTVETAMTGRIGSLLWATSRIVVVLDDNCCRVL